MDEFRFAILASGRGSNAVALMDAFARGFIPGAPVVVVSDVAEAPVLGKARERRVPVDVAPSRGRPREVQEGDLNAILERYGATHLLLAGYMRLLSPAFVRRWCRRILNIHPSILPDFPGLHAAERQWAAGVRVAGATVHLVDEGIDTGPVLLQGSIEVRGDEGPDGLARRILEEVEHVIYPRAVRLYVDRLRRAKETA